MKKIKLFALAAFAMMSTNVFAQHVLTSGQTQTINNLEYNVLTVYNTENATLGQINTVSVKANNWTGAALSITSPVKFTVQGTDDAGQAISKEASFQVVEIQEDAFLNNTNITSVSIPATVTKIGAFAFEGCENLATFTLAANSNLVEIGDGAFAYTSLATLDLTNATANPNGTPATTDDGMRSFGWFTASAVVNQTGSPFVSTKTSHTTNLMIKTVVLPTTCNTINAYAFSNSSNLATIDLSTIENIGPNAFEGCANKLTSVAIATGTNKVVGNIGKNAFAGCAKLATVEIGKIGAGSTIDQYAFGGFPGADAVNWAASDFAFYGALTGGTTPIATEGLADDYYNVVGVALVGEEGKVTVAEATAYNDAADALIGTVKIPAVAATVAAGVTTFTFNVIEAALNTAFDIATVRTLNFKNYIKTANLIGDATFQHAFPAPTETAKNVINYTYSDKGTGDALVKAFAQTAFAATAPATATITMNTTAEFEKYVEVTLATTIHKVNIEGGYTTNLIIGNADKKLVKDKNSSYYYYYVTLPSGDYRAIKKTQESGATVYVYQAYMDVVDGEATAFFQPVRVKNGEYVIGDNVVGVKNTFIVKSDKEDGVLATAATLSGTYKETTVSDGYGIVDQLKNTEATAYSLLKVQTAAEMMNGGEFDVWFFNNPTKSGFGFTKFDVEKQTGGLGKNCVYMQCPATASARLNLVWLDEAGNTTAIQTINTKAKAANGAIYNVAGQKVSASYKGLVIKDGKKYIQK